MPTNEYSSGQFMARLAADEADEAEDRAREATDPGLMAHAQVTATVAVAKALLAVEWQLDRLARRMEEK